MKIMLPLFAIGIVGAGFGIDAYNASLPVAERRCETRIDFIIGGGLPDGWGEVTTCYGRLHMPASETITRF